MVFHFFTTLKGLSFNSRQYQEYVIFFPKRKFNES